MRINDPIKRAVAKRSLTLLSKLLEKDMDQYSALKQSSPESLAAIIGEDLVSLLDILNTINVKVKTFLAENQDNPWEGI